MAGSSRRSLMRRRPRWSYGRRHSIALLIVALIIGAMVVMWPRRAAGEYFGRNKMQHEHFAFRVMPTPHCAVHDAPAKAGAAHDAARLTAGWHLRHQRVFGQSIRRSPRLFCGDQPDLKPSSAIVLER
jgi:hypothetical protein